MNDVYLVEVKDRFYTYFAKYGKTSASATMGREFAARRVISKHTGIPMDKLCATFKAGLIFEVTIAK